MLKRYIAICTLVLAALFICGCSAETTLQTYTYTEVYRRITEPYGDSFILNGNVQQTIVEGRTYEFQSSIKEEERTEFVRAQEKLSAYLEEQGVSVSDITLRVLRDYPNRTESETHIAYFDISSIKSWEQVLTTIQVSFGDYTNYGYLYALANHIAEDLEWQQDAVDEVSADGIVNDSSLLNLVYTCFDEAYTSAENIAVCKTVAKELLSDAKDIWSEEDFLQSRVNYAKAKNIDFEPTYLTFAYNGQSCPLKFRTMYMEVFKDYTYEQDHYVKLGRVLEDYFVSTDKIIKTFHWLDEQLKGLRDTFDVDLSALISVQLTANTGGEGNIAHAGVFVYELDSANIYAKTIHCLAHEYVHYLYWLRGGTNDSAYEQWINEVVAHYYTVAADFEDYCLIGRNEDPDRIDAIEALIGEDYDEPSDYIKFVRAVIRKRENVQFPYYLKTEYILCPAFGEYIVRIYGEETFLDCMLAPSKAKELTGKTIDEIVDDWCLDMQNPEND